MAEVVVEVADKDGRLLATYSVAQLFGDGLGIGGDDYRDKALRRAIADLLITPGEASDCTVTIRRIPN